MNRLKINDIVFLSALILNLISNIYSTYTFEKKLNKISLEFSSKLENLSNKLSIDEAKFKLISEKINDGNASLSQKIEMYQNNLSHKIDVSTLKIAADQTASLKSPIIVSATPASNFDFTLTTYFFFAIAIGLFSYICYSKMTSFFSWPDVNLKGLNNFQDLTPKSMPSLTASPSDSLTVSFGVPKIIPNTTVNLPPEELTFRPVVNNLFDCPQKVDPELMLKVAETVNTFDFSAATPFF